tara:strand:+ start:911 stop:1054 length:144 start_codon:yes stop_codon:yes gene_type:complete
MKIGIPYDSIMLMDEEEINMIIGIESAMNEAQNENAKMQSDLRRSQN